MRVFAVCLEVEDTPVYMFILKIIINSNPCTQSCRRRSGSTNRTRGWRSPSTVPSMRRKPSCSPMHWRQRRRVPYRKGGEAPTITNPWTRSTWSTSSWPGSWWRRSRSCPNLCTSASKCRLKYTCRKPTCSLSSSPSNPSRTPRGQSLKRTRTSTGGRGRPRRPTTKTES